MPSRKREREPLGARLDERITHNRVEADRLDDLMRRFRPAPVKVEEVRHESQQKRRTR